MAYVRNAMSFLNMSDSALQNAYLKRTNQNAQNVLFIAINWPEGKNKGNDEILRTPHVLPPSHYDM
jgi:hypothetical protein